MNLDIRGIAAIVTGASRGIGAAIARELAGEGADVLLVARSADALDQVAAVIRAEFGTRAVVHAADLRDRGAAAEVVRATLESFGRIDLLVNNAGATKRGDFFALSDEDWHDGFELKLHGHVRLCRAAWNYLRQARGAVVNIVGVGSRTPSADFTIGGAVNSALLNFTKALADIGRTEGVRVNAINPGHIQTERLTRRLEAVAQETGVPVDQAAGEVLRASGVERFGRPEEIGWLTAFLASPRAAYIHGATIDIDGGVTRGL